jgi:hypothetical protein
LAEELIDLPKPLPWGSSRSSTMSRSRKKLIWLHGNDGRAEPLMLSGPNAAPRKKLNADLAQQGVRHDSLCNERLASDLCGLFHINEKPVAFQANYSHSDFPMHYDVPQSDGFGKAIATLNVKDGATIIIDESIDHPEKRWRLSLRRGDAWAMRGYARERCSHGVSVGFALSSSCEQGCTSCRISLNLRCGEHTSEETNRLQELWHGGSNSTTLRAVAGASGMDDSASLQDAGKASRSVMSEMIDETSGCAAGDRTTNVGTGTMATISLVDELQEETGQLVAGASLLLPFVQGSGTGDSEECEGIAGHNQTVSKAVSPLKLPFSISPGAQDESNDLSGGLYHWAEHD